MTQRKYIEAVRPLENNVLQVDFVSGSRVLLDMSEQMEKLRFRKLKQTDVWNSARTNGIFVLFDGAEISHDEILDMVGAAKNEQ